MTKTKDTQFDALFNVVLDIMPRRDEDFADHAEWFAKELFDRGVVVLPYKAGDTFWYHGSYAVNGEPKGKTVVLEAKAQSIEITDDGITIYDERGLDYDLYGIFLTREEAEAALNRRADDDIHRN